MHIANMKVWVYCSKKYKKYFTGNNSIIEFGSHNVNGTIRNLFSGYGEYIGVDWRAGPNVDAVSLAHEFTCDHKFDAVVSSSMLEHDICWEKSVRKMVDLLKDDGCMILSWGSALNPPHCPDHACDSGFHSLPAKKVFDILGQLGMYVHEFKYEGKCDGVNKEDCVSSDGMGEVFLVAFKNKEYAQGDQDIDDFTPEDALEKTVDVSLLKKTGKNKKYFAENKEYFEVLRKMFPKPQK